MKTLTLPLKKPWFDKIKSGEKKEEYRNASWKPKRNSKVPNCHSKEDEQ